MAAGDETWVLLSGGASSLVAAPIEDLTLCATHADRKHRWLFDVLKSIDTIPELATVVSEEAR